MLDGAGPIDVAFILSSPRRAIGGLETIADNLARALAARGHRVSFVAGCARPVWRELPPPIEAAEVATPSASSPATRAGARLLRTSPLNVQSLYFFLRFLCSRRARRIATSADVAVTFFEGEAVLFSRYLGRRGVATVYYYSGGIDRRWARLDCSTRRVAISHAVAEHSSSRHAYPCHGVVWPGVSQQLREQPCRADAAGQPLRLVYTGRLEHNKRPDLLIACFAALAHEFPALTLRLVGDGPLRPDLAGQSAGAGLADRVVFAGVQPPDGVGDELRQADVFLFPSTYESFGLSVVEAMAAGVPVVASDLPALREATGGRALLVPPHDLASWIEATRALLSDASQRRERSREGRAWAAQLTWERAATGLERYLIEAIRSV